MQLSLYTLFMLFTIFCNEYNIVKAMLGLNVTAARRGEFGMVVSISIFLNETTRHLIAHRCTGTLVTRYDIVTVGHCVRSYQLHEVQILTGTVDLRAGYGHTVQWWLHYDEWASQMRIPLRYPTNDVVYIKLDHAVQHQFIPAVITNYTHNQLADRIVNTAGWSQRNGVFNYIQQKVSLNILAKEDCDAVLSQLTGVQVNSDLRILCGLAIPPVILEEGDNGNPILMNSNELVAIAIGACPNPVPNSDLQVNMLLAVEFYKNFFTFMFNSF